MEHSQGTISVFVWVCEIMLDRESLPATAEASEGHATTVEHTQSQAQ